MASLVFLIWFLTLTKLAEMTANFVDFGVIFRGQRFLTLDFDNRLSS